MRVSMLGPLHVRDDAGGTVMVGGRQVRTLLFLLAAEANRIVPGAVLAARLWPDAPGRAEPADPANALQTLVSRLRAALRPARLDGLVESHPAGYKLAVTAGAVDMLAFEAAATAGRRELAAGAATAAARTLDEALALWRGQPFAEAADNEHLASLTVRLTDLHTDTMLDRCEAGLALGEAASLIGDLKRQVAADPLAERPVSLLMRALTADGRPAEALTVYAQARERLADELGIDPSRSVEEVYLRILREPGAVPVADPAGVPATVTSFVGRDMELTEVSKLLGSARLVTLTGPGGVGKTRLATEAARHLDGRVRFVPLAPVRDPAEVAHAVVDAVGPREKIFGRPAAAEAEPVSRLTAALAGRDDVLILDNCEHVIGASAALVARLLAACPRLTVLTTSREPLRIDGETLYPVPVLVEDAAVRLLCDRAASVRPGFQLDAANAAAVVRVCRALDGMPLAIELAAVWLRVLSPAQLAERLDDRFALLTGGDRTALPRHQTLRAVVDWSWELLSEPERILARRLSAIPASATLTAAERVCAGDGLPRAAVLSALSGVVDKSLLTVDDGERYGMLETVRAYCLERLAEAGEARTLGAAVSDYFLELAERLDQRLRGPDQPQAMAELAAEQDNMHAALRLAIGREDAQSALRFIRSLSWFWMLRGGTEEALAREVRALADQAPDTQVMAEARVICALSANMSSWDVDQMRPALRRSLDALAAHLPGMTTVHPLAMLGEAMLAMCEFDPQRAFDSCDTLTRSDDPWLRAAASFFRAAIGGVLGRMDEVEADCRLALDQFRVLGDAWGTAGSLVQLSEFAELRGEHQRALDFLEEAMACAQRLGAHTDMDQLGSKLVQIRVRMGDLAGAQAELDRARTVSASHPRSYDWSVLLTLMAAELAWKTGDRPAAIEACNKAIAIQASDNSPWRAGMRALVRARLAAILLEDDHDQNAAAGLLARALEEAAGWVERTTVAQIIDVIAALTARRGTAQDHERAALLLGAAHQVRGCFDEGSLDSLPVRDRAHRALGDEAFAAAYQRGRDLAYQDAISVAAESAGTRETGRPV